MYRKNRKKTDFLLTNYQLLYVNIKISMLPYFLKC